MTAKHIIIYFAFTIWCFTSCNMKNTNNENNNGPALAAIKDSIYTESGYSDVNEIKMYYEKHGDKGDYLVLIHGGGSTIGTTFGKILPMLATDHQVIAVELQAHGHTGDRDAPESFEQDADDVAALMKNLNIPKASFFGFSNGGNTAMQIYMRHPELVNKLIVASAFYKREGLPPGFFDGMANATLKDMPQSLKDAFLAINPDTARLQTMFNKDRERMLHFKDWDDQMLRSIKVPVLIVSGDRDVVSTGHTAAMSGLIPDCRLMIFPATHGSYMGEIESPDPKSKMPAMLVDIVNDFLSKH